ncbi:pyridoxamine 5'-phosphate oxidase family protein [Candidatus Parcubacteria bacterium]|nr:MAG: pyridoxamine 5'-phosphate oxidase family protein [Candidatus Parcubacteria bacterium]
MKQMNRKILDYIKTQRICVLSVEMMDGSPHAATVHFAHTEDPLMFFFETDRGYRKSEPLFGRETTRASMVIGVDEGNMKTLQIDGEVRLLKGGEEKLFEDAYLGKFPSKNKKAADPGAVFFVFIPTWWRFTDWTGPQGKTIVASH